MVVPPDMAVAIAIPDDDAYAGLLDRAVKCIEQGEEWIIELHLQPSSVPPRELMLEPQLSDRLVAPFLRR
jgi:hypothetical protein